MKSKPSVRNWDIRRPATRGRLNKCFKYFRGKRVRVSYEYNDSLGGHDVRETCLTYDRFTIEGEYDFHVLLYRGDALVWEQYLGAYWEFEGLGVLRYINSGPYCWFTIKPLDQRNTRTKLVDGFWKLLENMGCH